MNSKESVSGVKARAKGALRIGLIDAGVMGSNHAAVLGLLDIALVRVVDPLPSHRTRAAELTNCCTFARLDQLIAEGVDEVTFAAPTHLHHEIAPACIAHGTQVLVEKLIGSSVEDPAQLAAAPTPPKGRVGRL